MKVVDTQIPPDIESQYEGEWIAWDTTIDEVVGHGDSLEQAIELSCRARDAGHLVWFHHVLPKDAVIVGGLY
jgi:hypothetical protein